MDIIKLYFNVVSLLGFFTVSIVGIIAYLRRDKKSENKFWFLLCMSASFWSLFFFLIINSPTKELSLLLRIFLDTFVILVVLFWLRFVFAFLDIRKDKFFNYVALSAFAMFLLNMSPNFIKDMVPQNGFNYYVEAGFGYYVYSAYFLFFISYGFILLFQAQSKTTGVKSNQIKYVILASILGFIGASSAFLLSFGVPFLPYPFILLPIFPLLILYAITKYHLFDIKVIATELLTFALWLVLSAKVFLSGTFQDIVSNGVILVFVVFFGILLIRSVINEVKQRDKIERMAEDVKKAYEVEKKANDELKKLDEYKNDFMRQAQHDLRTPLTVMMGYSDLLLDGSYGKLPKQAADVIKRIISVTQGKLKDINNFLDSEQFKMGKGVVLLKPGVELSPILEEIMGVLNSKAKEKGIYLKLEKSKKAFTINADREKLKSAIFNVIDNAVKYTTKGGVTIKTENHDSVKIIISDTGIGMPKDRIKNMLETQFERTKQAEKTASGSGVGLYLSGQIIKLHNGKIWAESEGEGKGTTFHIELPIEKEK